jgi:hypothetical protein
MQNNLRDGHRVKRIGALEAKAEASSPSYFQWQEQTVRMPAVSVAPQRHSSPIVRLFRRIARKR